MHTRSPSDGFSYVPLSATYRRIIDTKNATNWGNYQKTVISWYYRSLRELSSAIIDTVFAPTATRQPPLIPVDYPKLSVAFPLPPIRVLDPPPLPAPGLPIVRAIINPTNSHRSKRQLTNWRLSLSNQSHPNGVTPVAPNVVTSVAPQWGNTSRTPMG